MVVGDQHRHSAGTQGVADRNDVGATLGVHPSEGFIEEHQLGFDHQGAGDLQAPALTAREAARITFREVRKIELRQQTIEAARVLYLGIVMLQHDAHVVGDGELGEDSWFLGEVAHAQPGARIHGQRGDIAAKKGDAARFRLQQANDHAERGALAGAVGAQQADDFALIHPHIHTRHHLAPGKTLGKPCDREEGHCG